MQILALPLLADNYAWLLWREGTPECAVVDPSEGAPVAEAIAARGLQLKWILATHHHADHVGGITHLAKGGVEVIASQYDQKRVPCVSRALGDGEEYTLLGETLASMLVPGHTLGAVAFYFARVGAVFTGDTLFAAGCGRLFEGSAAQMYASLTALASLPPQTRVYCGHEYSEKNLRFAAQLEAKSKVINERLQEVCALRAKNLPTIPTTIGLEKATNPFLRADTEAMAAATQQKAGIETFVELRRRRDAF